MKDFSDKLVWITGASSGIGREMAIQSADLGARVVLSARNLKALEEVERQVSEKTETLIVPLDMERQEDFAAAVEKVINHFGRIDLMFLCAGVSQRSVARETEMAIERKIMEINFFANIGLTKLVLPHMRRQKEGYFAVISSITGKTGFYLRSTYAASKHALHGYYESLRLEEYDHNIGVSIICPGPVNTNIARNSLNAEGQAQGIQDHMQEKGMSAKLCVSRIIKSIQRQKLEVIISQGPEAFGMMLKCLLPKIYFNKLRHRNARG